VTEELTLHEVVGYGGAVDLEKGPVAARRDLMHMAGNDVFARAALAEQQQGVHL
jgi:hypothetical protein